MRNAFIEVATGLVINVVEIEDGDGSTNPPGFEAIPSDTANIGDTWDGTKFVPPSA